MNDRFSRDWHGRERSPKWRDSNRAERSDRPTRRGRDNNYSREDGRRDFSKSRSDRSRRHESGSGWSGGGRRRSGGDGRGKRGWNSDNSRGRGKFSDRRSSGKRFNDRARSDRREDRGPRDFRKQNKWDSRRNEPAIPANVKADSLDPIARKALNGLNADNAETVARHLVMAGSLIDIDPEAAYAHAQAAVARAGRIGPVREAAALAAYACEKFPEALREVRAVRRLTGEDSLRAIEADCERGIGKPEKALEIIGETSTAGMSVGEQAELALVASGARADLGEPEAGLLVIEDFLDTRKVEDDEVLSRLLQVKVDRLRELGREEEADQVEAEIPAVPEPLTIVDFDEVVEADMEYVPSDLQGCRKPLSQNFELALVDLDGVAYMGSNPIKYADTGLMSAKEGGMELVFVTNNASRTRQEVKDKLAGYGIEVDEDKIMTSAMDGVAILKEILPPGAKVLSIGGNGLRKAVAEGGFELVESADDRPAAVIQGYDPSVGWAELSEGAYAINQGAAFVATNMDATLPTERGFSLGNGSLVRAVEHATGVSAKAGGKPFPGIYRHAVELAEGSKAMCIGDRLDTDIAGARAAGYPVLHLLTGVASAKDVALAKKEERPTYLGLDMRSLLEPVPGPVKTANGDWTCGSSRAFRVERGTIQVDEVPLKADSVTLKLDDYRALVAAVWEARDNRDRVTVPQIEVTRNPEVEDAADQEATPEQEADDTEVNE
ncbi:HAD-IIA family hydrolase [Winkia neuii]|uniref:HAD-IA family hydrolase n=1 Tax=Winkia neuii subsp. anitrata TaxID=29318 RepID=A0AB38XSB1_9ACTO|nr:HAD-IA family hydrolase [Winkia neuii]MDU2270072.1 HAD-IA family hydrolase [Winkia neuii]WCE46971.1 HAD-IA family hydrolase [Winkia neuii subsp. anitrata]